MSAIVIEIFRFEIAGVPEIGTENKRVAANQSNSVKSWRKGKGSAPSSKGLMRLIHLNKIAPNPLSAIQDSEF
jgi:hypothetical protein